MMRHADSNWKTHFGYRDCGHGIGALRYGGSRRDDLRHHERNGSHGGSWIAPTSLTNALVIGKSNDVIWLAQGVYTNSATFTMHPTVFALYGGFTNGMARGREELDAYPTLLDGQGANKRVVTVSGIAITWMV